MVSMTGGGRPPKEPVKVWTLVPDAVEAEELAAGADDTTGVEDTTGVADATGTLLAALDALLVAETPRAELKAYVRNSVSERFLRLESKRNLRRQRLDHSEKKRQLRQLYTRTQLQH